MTRTIPQDNFISGRWTRNGSREPNLNPSDLRDVVAEQAIATRADVEEAVAAAAGAFRTWSRVSISERADVLDRVGTELARKEQFSAICSRARRERR